jgi:hypothetical protein
MNRLVAVVATVLAVALLGPLSSARANGWEPRHMHAPPTVLWGLESGPRLASTEAELGRTADIVSWFVSPTAAHAPLAKMEAKRAEGSIPMISWEPNGSLADVAAGRDDAQIIAWAKDFAAYGHPVYFRPWAEFTGSWNSYYISTPADAATMRVAWRRLVQLFRAHGATDALYVWNVGYSGLTAQVRQAWPGPHYVTDVGIDAYARTPKECFSMQCHYITALTQLRRFTQKPVVLAEWGIANGPGKGAVFRRTMAGLAAYGVVASVYFDHQGVLDPTLDWSLDQKKYVKAERRGVNALDIINYGLQADECYATHNSWEVCAL